MEGASVCPLVGIGTLPPPLPQASVFPPPPKPKGGGQWAHSPTGEGVGESHFRRKEKKLRTLSTLWAPVVNNSDRKDYIHLLVY
jgi:hypothetical protein